jgi:hypothetical protein
VSPGSRARAALDQPGRERSVDDAATEPGAGGEPVVEVQPVRVAAGPGEPVHVLVVDSFREPDGVADGHGFGRRELPLARPVRLAVRQQVGPLVIRVVRQPGGGEWDSARLHGAVQQVFRRPHPRRHRTDRPGVSPSVRASTQAQWVGTDQVRCGVPPRRWWIVERHAGAARTDGGVLPRRPVPTA